MSDLGMFVRWVKDLTKMSDIAIEVSAPGISGRVKVSGVAVHLDELEQLWQT